MEFADSDVSVDFLDIGRPTVEIATGWRQPTRAEREAAGMTQEEVAKLYGVTVRTVRRWERGQG